MRRLRLSCYYWKGAGTRHNLLEGPWLFRQMECQQTALLGDRNIHDGVVVHLSSLRQIGRPFATPGGKPLI